MEFTDNQLKSQNSGINSAIYLGLQNSLILHKIFGQLSLKSLKIARLVCRNWSVEAAKEFGKSGGIMVRTDVDDKTSSKLSQLEQFLHLNQLPITMMLYLINTPWVKDGKTRDERCRPFTEFFFASQVLNYLTAIGYLVQVLRLELLLVTVEECHLFGEILLKCTQLKAVSLDIVNYGVINATLPVGATSSIKAVTFRTPYRYDVHYYDTFLEFEDTFAQWFSLFGHVEFIDFLGWKHKYDCYHSDIDCHDFLRILVKLMKKDSETFPNLVGIKGELLSRDGYNYYATFPKLLKHIYIQAQRQEGHLFNKSIAAVQSILNRHSTTLTVFNLRLYGTYSTKKTGGYQKLRLPVLPSLERLGIANGVSAYYGYNVMDVFNLRSIFLGGPQRLQELLPSLNSISLIFFNVTGGKFWEHIIPEFKSPSFSDPQCNKEPLQFAQIQELNTTLDTACSSPEVDRLYRIFPKLLKFSHIIREKKCEQIPDFDDYDFWENLQGCVHISNEPPLNPTWTSNHCVESCYFAKKSVFWDHAANFEKDLSYLT